MYSTSVEEVVAATQRESIFIDSPFEVDTVDRFLTVVTSYRTLIELRRL